MSDVILLGRQLRKYWYTFEEDDRFLEEDDWAMKSWCPIPDEKFYEHAFPTEWLYKDDLVTRALFEWRKGLMALHSVPSMDALPSPEPGQTRLNPRELEVI